MRIKKKRLYIVLVFAIIVCGCLYVGSRVAEAERREALVTDIWVGNDGYPIMDFLPDGSVAEDRANSEMIGRVRIEEAPFSAIEGYYRVHQKCRRIFVFDNNDIRLGTFDFDGEILKTEGGEIYSRAEKLSKKAQGQW